jgi:hypothetical protein
MEIRSAPRGRVWDTMNSMENGQPNGSQFKVAANFLLMFLV